MALEQTKKGFTLLELIVALGIFSIISLVTTGSLLALVAVEKKSANFQSNQDNVRFAFELMAIEIKHGILYESCPTVTDNTCFQFKNIFDEDVVYKLSTDAHECGVKPGTAVSCIAKSVDGGGAFSPLTAPEVEVNALKFYVTGNNPHDGYHPRVTIILRSDTPGVADPKKSVLHMQTTISQLDAET